MVTNLGVHENGEEEEEEDEDLDDFQCTNGNKKMTSSTPKTKTPASKRRKFLGVRCAKKSKPLKDMNPLVLSAASCKPLKKQFSASSAYVDGVDDDGGGGCDGCGGDDGGGDGDGGVTNVETSYGFSAIKLDASVNCGDDDDDDDATRNDHHNVNKNNKNNVNRNNNNVNNKNNNNEEPRGDDCFDLTKRPK